jgi:hypothetical protein
VSQVLDRGAQADARCGAQVLGCGAQAAARCAARCASQVLDGTQEAMVYRFPGVTTERNTPHSL